MSKKIKRLFPILQIRILLKKIKRMQKTASMKTLKMKIVKRYDNIPKNEISSEIQDAVDFLRENLYSISPYPHPFTKKYHPKKIKVFRDKGLKMNYVLHDGKKLYFKSKMNGYNVRNAYSDLLVEQDLESPHRYETREFSVLNGDIVADIGSAEGIFALSVVERAKKLYLFESDKEWIDALKATFEPWKDKVTIIRQYVSDVDTDNTVTIDRFFDQNPVDFIKADVEGAEPKLLNGATKLLAQQNPLKIAICTYHKKDDAKIVEEILGKHRFSVNFSDGYCLLHIDDLEPPFFRKCLIRARKD